MITVDLRSDSLVALRMQHDLRSDLEASVYSGLLKMGVQVSYEEPSGYEVPYLPDFTWTGEFEAQDQAEEYASYVTAYMASGGKCCHFRWMEVKPQEFIYKLFNECLSAQGTSARQISPRFKGAIDYKLDHKWLWARKSWHEVFEELARPKKLAEVSGNNVLVMATTGGTETLSACLTPDGIIFERNHPLVNGRGWFLQMERRRKEAERAREAEAARVAWEQREQERLRQAESDRAALEQAEQERKDARLAYEALVRPELMSIFADGSKRESNFRGQKCCSCGEWVEPLRGQRMLRYGQWWVIHHDCVGA